MTIRMKKRKLYFIDKKGKDNKSTISYIYKWLKFKRNDKCIGNN